MVSADHWGVVLLAHGAPDCLEDIPEFLLNVRGGRKLAEAVVQEITHRYRLIGGGSPLLKLTRAQAEALTQALKREPTLRQAAPIPVAVGMRNWKPFIADSVQQLSEDGVKRLVALCLAPQNSSTSVGLYREHLTDASKKFAPGLGVEFVESWHNHPQLIAAFCEKASRALERAEAVANQPVPVIFSAHSVPERTIADGDPYARQVRETAALVAEAMGCRPTQWRVAYQSQGMTAEPWVGPGVESQIDALAADGYRHILIAPIGFVSDNVEVLYDIDIVFRQYGRALGVTVWRSESLNDSPLFIRALASIVSERMRAATTATEVI